MTQTFRSKVDAWIGLALVLGPVAALSGVFTAPPQARLPAIAAVAFMAAIYAGLVLPLRYVLTEQELIVRSGLLFRQRVVLADITRVEPTRSPLSAPALSLDRLRIERRGGRPIVISPDERDDFMRELALRARLVRRGNGLVR